MLLVTTKIYPMQYLYFIQNQKSLIVSDDYFHRNLTVLR